MAVGLVTALVPVIAGAEALVQVLAGATALAAAWGRPIAWALLMNPALAAV